MIDRRLAVYSFSVAREELNAAGADSVAPMPQMQICGGFDPPQIYFASARAPLTAARIALEEQRLAQHG